jgi:hypothetical protein
MDGDYTDKLAPDLQRCALNYKLGTHVNQLQVVIQIPPLLLENVSPLLRLLSPSLSLSLSLPPRPPSLPPSCL